MDQVEPIETVKCQLRPALPLATQPLEEGTPLETHGPPGPGVLKRVRIGGTPRKVFVCFTEAHPDEDHRFQVADRVVSVPRDKSLLARKDTFFHDEVTWE